LITNKKHFQRKYSTKIVSQTFRTLSEAVTPAPKSIIVLLYGTEGGSVGGSSHWLNPV